LHAAATNSIPTSNFHPFSRRRDQKAVRSKGLRRRGAVCGVAAPTSESPQAANYASRHPLRRVSLRPTPRRSHRRLTPFFHALLRPRIVGRCRPRSPAFVLRE